MAKKDSGVYHIRLLLQEWDKATKDQRKTMLNGFINEQKNKTGQELDSEMAMMASLFLARITVWLKLTYLNGCMITEQLKALHIFLSASNSQRFLLEFLDQGGIQCLLDFIVLKHAYEEDKKWAVQIMLSISDSGNKFKEIICESYGIRAICECMAKSQSEATQYVCREILESLSNGNPKYVNQVYKGLIGVLPCNSPKAQQLSLQLIVKIQKQLSEANRALIDRIPKLLESLHLEVQSATIELIRDLMKFDISDGIIKSLVSLLKPAVEINPGQFYTDDKNSILNERAPLPVFIQQAAAAKCIQIITSQNIEICEKLIQNEVVHHLMYAMGNIEYADSQRQAAIGLEFFCKSYTLIAEHVRKAMDDSFYANFIENVETIHRIITPLQADVLISNQLFLSKGM